ncbi:hypothetical protein K7432_013334 [Basidiobolus ranarum]|uniref:FLZ-type domain-containing protein n=1 Tax=Basidiobolus ranarum TaxID=34480 RepID=A0ABR2VQW8_9FUNG
MEMDWCIICDKQVFVRESLYCSDGCRQKDHSTAKSNLDLNHPTNSLTFSRIPNRLVKLPTLSIPSRKSIRNSSHTGVAVIKSSHSSVRFDSLLTPPTTPRLMPRGMEGWNTLWHDKKSPDVLPIENQRCWELNSTHFLY